MCITSLLSIAGAVFAAENEQEDRVHGPGAPVRAGHVVRDVRRAAAVRQTGRGRFPRVRRLQTGRPVGRGGRVVVADVFGATSAVLGRLRAAPVARQATRVRRGRRLGTVPGRRRHVRAAGRDPRGLAARGGGHRQEASARRRGRSVYRATAITHVVSA